MPGPSGIIRAIERFIAGITNLPVGQRIDEILEDALVAEHEIRLLFASDPQNHQLQNLFLGLIDVFRLHPAARRTRSRQIDPDTKERTARYVFPVNAEDRRLDLTPSTVFDIEAFQRHWDIFTHGALSKMTPNDWKNVVAAGGSVQACLIAPRTAVSPEYLNKFYQSGSYAPSDIDLFLWGLSPTEAEVKMKDIYRAVCAAAPWKSPAEILAGFDIDAASCAYDGKRVWVNPRSLAAFVRQANMIDVSRRSPSYEMRLAKYAEWGFEVYIPSLHRERVKQSIYSKDLFPFPNGLARLLVLEKAYYRPHYYIFLEYPKVHYLHTGSISEAVILYANDLPMNNYDGNVGWAQIPYGVHWDVQKIEKMILKKEEWLNSPLNPHNEGQNTHKHIFFSGTMEQCLAAFCPDCGPSEDTDCPDITSPGWGTYIRGPIRFITINAGRQLMMGSFRPIEVGDWLSKAYENRDEL
ncbi:hypothetical protein CPB84DRAFT_1852977 [Gymnopilus junonius]|uniref:Uncharacterized protein n=1 Tax=Gymnopilus junonius TaxID=109634 RepID=A0A9P5NBI5_GYMJU|nr:hypothetical protein CPB84DRAFT_1852977 [Gymnopilus junonius]